MADLILASSTYGVGTADTASTIVNNVTAQDAQHINGPVSAILQIEAALGNAVTLKGSHTDLAARLAVSLAADGTLLDALSLAEPGDIVPSFRTSKTGWLLMGATERSNTTYTDLLDQIISRISVVSTNAIRVGTGKSCTVDHTTDTFTSASHGFGNNTVLYFVASVVPSGMAVLTKYFVINSTTNTFQISTTVGGAAVALTSNGATVVAYSTFVTDVRGTALIGADNMGGSSRNVATDSAADNIGQSGGSESSVATHSHSITDPGHTHAAEFSLADGNAFKTSGTGAHGTPPNATTGITINNSGTSTGNMMPYTTVNYFIKY